MRAKHSFCFVNHQTVENDWGAGARSHCSAAQRWLVTTEGLAAFGAVAYRLTDQHGYLTITANVTFSLDVILEPYSSEKREQVIKHVTGPLQRSNERDSLAS